MLPPHADCIGGDGFEYVDPKTRKTKVPMSYDIWLEIDVGGDEPACVGDSWNYTSNMSHCWCAAGADLAEFDGKAAGECAAVLDAAIERMRAEPDTYRKFDASNGWGTYDSLVPALEQLRLNLRKHPKASVRVSR